ncbi:hypothetical protein [Nitrosopumilus sp.]|nr:hypothetical protein [Nitrosopumilus sp.]
MNVKKTSSVEELQKIMKAKLDDGKNVSRKKIKRLMNDFVNS